MTVTNTAAAGVVVVVGPESRCDGAGDGGFGDESGIG